MLVPTPGLLVKTIYRLVASVVERADNIIHWTTRFILAEFIRTNWFVRCIPLPNLEQLWKVPKTFRARKTINKTPTRLLCKVKISARFRASRRLRFDDTKRIMSPEMGPKRFSGHNVFVLEKRFEGRCKARAHFNIAHQVLLIYSYYYQKWDFRE